MWLMCMLPATVAGVSGRAMRASLPGAPPAAGYGEAAVQLERALSSSLSTPRAGECGHLLCCPAKVPAFSGSGSCGLRCV